MKIVVLDRSSVGEDVSVEAIKQFGEVDFYNSTPDELVAERIADANIVVANKSPMNESTMKDAKQVKMICQLSTGYDNVDIEYCKNRGIHVANARNYSTAAVAPSSCQVRADTNLVIEKFYFSIFLLSAFSEILRCIFRFSI